MREKSTGDCSFQRKGCFQGAFCGGELAGGRWGRVGSSGPLCLGRGGGEGWP